MARFNLHTLLFALAILLPLICAINPNGRTAHFAHLTQPYRSQHGFFTTLRDSVIQRIWDVPTRRYPRPSKATQMTIEDAPSSFRARYGGDVVLRFNFKTQEEMSALADAADTLYLDVWESTDEWVDIRLAKDVVSSLLGLLPSSLQNAHSPLMHDLASAIFESYPSGPILQQPPPATAHQQVFTPSLRRPQDDPSEGRELFFQDYQPMSVMLPWMRLMASLFPTHTRMINIGVSYEGRDIPALKVGVHPTNSDQPGEPRKTIIISGGSHAREWISTSTVNYVAYQMITHYGKWPGITKLIEEFDWVFIPTINPDGYVYTWDNDRLWRKNRQQTDIRFCRGVDLDRAWNFAWDGQSTRSNPCSENYAGTNPFEAVEARRFADWARNETETNNADLVAFIDLHSYSQQVLYPYSYSCSSTPPSLENLEELGMGLAKAFRLTNGHFYGVSSACEGSINGARRAGKEIHARMDPGGGSALDWFYHEMNVKYAYQIKLRDTGSYGFLLPRNNIVPTGQETFNAVAGLGRFLLSNKGIEIAWEKELLASNDELLREQARQRDRDTATKEIADQVVDEKEMRTEESVDEDEWVYMQHLKHRRRR